MGGLLGQARVPLAEGTEGLLDACALAQLEPLFVATGDFPRPREMAHRDSHGGSLGGKVTVQTYHRGVAQVWTQVSRDVRRQVSEHLDAEVLRQLHRRSAVAHLLVALRQVVVLGLAVWAILAHGEHAWVWIPASIVIGVVVFSLTVLLHEVVHRVVFERERPRLTRLLGHLYAMPSGLSQSQFHRWHLDHHDHLGSSRDDPKRAHLSPKKNARWLKALYFTPALFPIYFRAARCAQAGYPPELRARIRRERLVAIGFHLALPTTLWLTLGPAAALKLHLVPVFLVFPVVFALNRLGQHYDFVPEDPVRWGSVLRPSPFFWDQVFLWSNYHLEHHYFPKVPFYRLRALHRALGPFFDAHDVPRRTYAGLLCDWLVRNRVPHTNWSKPRTSG